MSVRCARLGAMTPAATGQPTGRPRDGRVDEAVRAATRELLLEVGYRRLSIEQVAARAQVGKGAVYRRWSSKVELVFAHVFHDLDLPDPPDAGSLRADVSGAMRHLAAEMAEPVAAAAVPGLLADLAASGAVRQRFLDTFVAREREMWTVLLGRAVERGELAEVPDVGVVQALTVGPLIASLMVVGAAPR